MPDWLVQNLTSQMIWEICLVIGGGALLGIAKAKWPKVSPYILYAVAGATCIALMLYTLTGHAILSKQPPQINATNAEETIKQWAYSLGLGISRPPGIPSNFMFEDTVTLKDGLQVSVYIDKQLPDYVQFQTNLVLSQEHQKALLELSPDDRDRVADQVMLELARGKIGNMETGPQSAGKAGLLQNITLLKSFPVERFSKDDLVNGVDSMDIATQIVKTVTSLALEHRKSPSLKPQLQ